MCLNLFTVYMLLSHMLCVRLTRFLIKGHLLTYLLTYLFVCSYVSVGELWAFVIGWNMILEYMIGAASTGKAWSQYLDSFLNNTIRR